MTIDISIPGYELKRQVGKGGMATVYLAVQESFGRDVALKVMSPLLNADPSFSMRFLREARIVSQMHHGHIVPVYDVGEHKRIEFLSMEFLAGGDLRGRVNQNPGVEFALEVCIPMAFALDYAHSKGVLHRDVKPENILFREDGTPVLTDFGIARAADTGTALTQTGMLVGTPAYVSPEQAKGLALDGRTDLYSLGIVFYELLTGIQPYRADSAISVVLKHLNDAIPTLPPRFAHLQPFLNRALAKDPAGRFATGAEMAQAMQEYLPSSYGAGRTVAPAAGFRASNGLPNESGVVPQDATATLSGFTVAGTALPGTGVLSWLRAPALRYGALAAVAAALVVGGVAYLLGSGEERSFAVASSSTAANSADAAMDEMMQLLTDAGVARLSKDMAQAETLYRRVLAMDGQNKVALTGMAAIAEHYRDLARDALAVKDMAAAQDAILRVVGIEPTDPQAENLQAQLMLLRDQQQAAEMMERQQAAATSEAASLAQRPAPKPAPVENRAARLESLLAKAQQAESRGQRLAPRGDNALEYYLAIRDIDANNDIARRGLAGIALDLTSRLEQALRSGNASAAEAQLAQLRRIDPARPGLARYAAKIEGVRQEQQAVLLKQERREQKTEVKAMEVLAKGDRYLQNGLTLRNVYSAGRLHAKAAELAPSLPEVGVFRDRVQIAFENLLNQEITRGNAREIRDVLDSARKIGFLSPKMAREEATLSAR